MDNDLRQQNPDSRTRQLVVSALMICLVVLGTLMFRVPVPMTQGYIHLGDTMIFLGVMLLSRRSAAAAAGIGSAMADILGGFAFWAPWSFFIKAGMAYTAALIIDKHSKPGASETGSLLIHIIAMAAGGLMMCGGYLAAERIMYGSWAAAIIGVPWNIGQFAAGAVFSLILFHALSRTPLVRNLPAR